MRYDVNRMGEQHRQVERHWLASITTGGEYSRVKALKVGETVSFERAVTGPAGKVSLLEITRTS